MDSAAAAGAVEPYSKIGVHQTIVVPEGASPASWINSVAEVVPKLAELG